MANDSIINKYVFPLTYIAAVSVSKCQPHYMDVLPNELKLYLHNIQLNTNHFEFPTGSDCYAEIMDETFGIEAIAEFEFENIYISNFLVLAKILWQTFCRSCKISLVKNICTRY